MVSLTTNHYPSEFFTNRDVEDNWIYEWPVIAGVATREEVDHATLKELQYLNALADKKQAYVSGPFGLGGEE